MMGLLTYFFYALHIFVNKEKCCFYMIQAVYSTYILIRLSRKTEKKTKRSCSLIVAVAMILYSSIALAFLFGDS